MSETGQTWLRRRLSRHLSELMRLAWPVIVARAGVMAMALIDIVMVGHYATTELAYLGIGMAPFMPVFLILLGLLLGTAVMTSAALGGGNLTECGAVWRRSVPYSIGLGLLGALAAAFGEPLLLGAGQTPELAINGGRIMFVLGLGLPAYLLYITSALFLEGVKNPKPAMIMMIVANLGNVGLNCLLVYG
ncbi:MAG: MATE family efflux transporter, partial [Alphaproteobacteria bacterium]